jgi:hypothetical protein
MSQEADGVGEGEKAGVTGVDGDTWGGGWGADGGGWSTAGGGWGKSEWREGGLGERRDNQIFKNVHSVWDIEWITIFGAATNINSTYRKTMVLSGI